MAAEDTGRTEGCHRCVKPLGFEFTMAFQPILDLEQRRIFGHEALVRGVDGAGAGAILALVQGDLLHSFDQAARVKAIELAAGLGFATGEYLSINFIPNAVYNPENCLRTSIAACERTGFPIEQVVFELTESEKVSDVARMRAIILEYRSRGFITAIDDFGAGYAGLHLLAEFQSDIVKLDMQLIRNIHADKVRQTIISGMISICQNMEIRIIAEGIETLKELRCLQDMGVNLFQGYLFAKPAFEQRLTPDEINWPE